MVAYTGNPNTLKSKVGDLLWVLGQPWATEKVRHCLCSHIPQKVQLGPWSEITIIILLNGHNITLPSYFVYSQS